MISRYDRVVRPLFDFLNESPLTVLILSLIVLVQAFLSCTLAQQQMLEQARHEPSCAKVHITIFGPMSLKSQMPAH
jgi:hypothetical protein